MVSPWVLVPGMGLGLVTSPDWEVVSAGPSATNPDAYLDDSSEQADVSDLPLNWTP